MVGWQGGRKGGRVVGVEWRRAGREGEMGNERGRNYFLDGRVSVEVDKRLPEAGFLLMLLLPPTEGVNEAEVERRLALVAVVGFMKLRVELGVVLRLLSGLPGTPRLSEA